MPARRASKSAGRRCHRSDYQRHDRRGRQRQQDDGAEAAEARADEIRGVEPADCRREMREHDRDAEPREEERRGEDQVREAERQGAGERRLLHDVDAQEQRDPESGPEPEASEGRRQLLVDGGGSEAFGPQVHEKSGEPEAEHRERDGDERVVAQERDGQRPRERQLEHEQAHARSEEDGVVPAFGLHGLSIGVRRVVDYCRRCM
jgi:hypothetical protein